MWKIFNSSRKGYIFALMCIVLPVLLLGVKYCVDQVSYSQDKLYGGGKILYKQCAADAALAVAQKWNPGLTLNQQKETLLRIADDIYNKSPTYCRGDGKDDRNVHQAIPGLEIKYSEVKEGGMFDPLTFTWKSPGEAHHSSTRIIPYVTYDADAFKERREYSGTVYPTGYAQILYMLDRVSVNPLFADEEIFTDVIYSKNANTAFYITARQQYNPANVFPVEPTIHKSKESAVYTRRSDPNDNKVQITVENDKIRVQTDDNICLASPACCNVDIILTIPTNTAASSQNNNDTANSTETGYAMTGNIAAWDANSSLEDQAAVKTAVAKTPIYQIAQAYRKFLRENFLHTRGVNVGLIPYSGKISISPDRIDWCRDSYPFVGDYYDAQDPNVRIPSQSFRLCFLRGAKHTGTLTDAPDPLYWSVSSGYGIMYRIGKAEKVPKYGNNWVIYGDLLSTDAPVADDEAANLENVTEDSSKRFQKMPMCLSCNADLLHGVSYNHLEDRPNPYYVQELTPNVLKIINVLGLIWPYQSAYNTSNFIFIPLTWANNLLQNWTSDPQCAVVDTLAESSSPATGGQLSRQSKTAAGRKKAIILVVNKPDHFEPCELTYLGFSHDYTDYPMCDSDKIYFSNNVLNGTKGTNFSYTKVSGRQYMTNGMLVASGDCVGRLDFKYRNLVKLVVDKLPQFLEEHSGKQILGAGGRKFTFTGATLVNAGNVVGANFIHNVSKYKVRYTLNNAKITNCVLKGQILRNLVRDPISNKPIIGNDGLPVHADYPKTVYKVAGYANTYDSCLTIMQDGTPGQTTCGGWVTIYHEVRGMTRGTVCAVINNGARVLLKDCNGKYTIPIPGSSGTTPVEIEEGCPGRGLHFIFEPKEGCFYRLLLKNADDKHFIENIANDDLINNTGVGLQKDESGKDWIVFQGDGELEVTVEPLDPHRGESSITFYDDNRGATSGDDHFLQFTNVEGDTEVHQITDRTEFYIKPENIADGTINNHNIQFNMKNLQLITAEITNRPYKEVTPVCSLSANGNNTVTIVSDVKIPLQIGVEIPGSVTFSNVNSTALGEFVGEKTLTGSHTFSIPNTCFSSNYGVEKIGCSFNNAKITSATLNDQTLRMVFSASKKYDSCLVAYSGYAGQFDSRGGTWELGGWSGGGCFKFSWPRMSGTLSGIMGVDCGYDTYGVKIYFDDDPSTTFLDIPAKSRPVENIPYEQSFIDRESVKLDASGYKNGNCGINLVDRILLKPATTPQFYENPEGEPIDGVWLTDDKLCFHGTGDLELTVLPNPGTIQYETPAGAQASTTVTDRGVIQISPQTHKYVKNSEGKYEITLALDSVLISGVQARDAVALVYDDIPAAYDHACVANFQKQEKEIDSAIKTRGDFVYDSALGGYAIGTANDVLMWVTDYRGAHLFIQDEVEDDNKLYRQYLRSSSYYNNSVISGGLGGRNTSAMPWYLPRNSTIEYARLIFARTDANSAESRAILGWFGLPMNCALYFGAGGNETHKYSWQSQKNSGNDSLAFNYDQDEACKLVTTDACNKLKDDWNKDGNENLRIYVIKYRKQTAHYGAYYFNGSNGKIAQATITDNAAAYSYLDACASSGSYVYDVANEAGLNDKLQEIATNIKEWANYTPATK